MKATEVETGVKLDQLTSLRFFAAVMVVICHSAGLFGFVGGPELDGLRTGVSFFFVLSGFILAYVYPKLDTIPELLHFLRARFARIWPAHFVTFLLAFWLLSLKWDGKLALANLSLVHAWIPQQAVNFSYNSPSWSISTELFFYLAFPLLLHRLIRNWHIKFILAGAIVAVLVSYSNVAYAPSRDYSRLLYINPLARILEFLFGMCLQQLWMYRLWSKAVVIKKPRWQALATPLELGAILLCGLSIYYLPTMPETQWDKWPGPAFTEWVRVSGGPMLPFGILIYVMALGRGGLSRVLARPWLVRLGEISYSVYLLHQILLRYYAENLGFFPALPNVVAFALYWSILLLGSYVLWTWVEVPARRWLLAGGSVHGPVGAQPSWRTNPMFSRKTTSAALLLVGILFALHFVIERSRLIMPAPGSVAAKTRLAKDIAQENIEDLRLLLDTGIDPNTLDSAHSPSLLAAAWTGNKEIVELLVARGADPNLPNLIGMTALSAAVDQQHPDMVRLLAGKGGSVDAATRDGNTPLMNAAWSGDRDMVALLLSLGANANLTRADGYTALVNASMQGYGEIVKALAAAGARVDVATGNGSTPLMDASWKGDKAMVSLLLSLGANVNVTRPDGYTALVSASIQGHGDIVKMLAAAGARVDAATKDGNTPLMIAAWKGNLPLVTLLLAAGADVSIQRADGFSAISLARSAKHQDILELIAARAPPSRLPAQKH